MRQSEQLSSDIQTHKHTHTDTHTNTHTQRERERERETCVVVHPVIIGKAWELFLMARVKLHPKQELPAEIARTRGLTKSAA